jgi:hypothetical protein
MKRILSIYTLLSLLLLSSCLCAQDAAGELKELGRIYQHSAAFSMKVEMNLRGGNIPAKASPGAIKGWMKKSGRNYLSSMAGKTTLSNHSCIVVVLEDQKVILYNASGKDSVSTDPLVGMRDSMFYANTQISFMQAPPGKKKVELKYNKDSGSAYRKIEITYLPGQYMEEIVFYNKTDAKEASVPDEVHIRYYDVKMNLATDESEFAETNFIRHTKKGLEPVDRFKDYQVIDQRDQKNKN